MDKSEIKQLNKLYPTSKAEKGKVETNVPLEAYVGSPNGTHA